MPKIRYQEVIDLEEGEAVRLHNEAKELGLAVGWTGTGWLIIPSSKLPHGAESVDLNTLSAEDVLFEGESLISLKYLLMGINYRKANAQG